MKNKYTVIFANEDGTALQTESLDYGTMPEYKGVTPTKAADAQSVYTFAGWAPVVETVTGAATYTATYTATPVEYAVHFINGEDTLQTSMWAYGQTPAYSGATPIKAADAKYTYTFAGWTPAIAPVTGEATYTAQFDQTTNMYTVIFRNDDGTELQNSEWAYEQTPIYGGATPTKPADAQYTYTFDKWSPAIVAVTGNAIYTATYTKVAKSYTITFVNEDGTELKSSNWQYGKTPVYDGATPTKAADEHYTYTFSGWTPEIVPVTASATYTATFTAEAVKFTVIFKNEDGTELQNTEVEYGTMPEYKGAIPTKAETAQYSYEFSGWTPELAVVTRDTTYTAQFKQTVRTYTITWSMHDAELKEQVAYGVVPTAPQVENYYTTDKVYTFNSWNKEVVAVTGDETYTATYTSSFRLYTVTFIVGPIQYSVEVAYETPMSVIIDGALTEALSFYGFTKDADGNFVYNNGRNVYTFIGWDKDLPEKVTEDATYTAIYTIEPWLAIDEVEAQEEVPATKIMENGVLYIIRGDQKFSNTGRLVE